MLIMPLGGLIKNPNKGNPLGTTDVGQGRAAASATTARPIRPGDQQPGSLETVFPAVPGRQQAGRRRRRCSSGCARSRSRSSSRARARPDFGYGEYVAYSKICTHAGCPASLYEQQTSRLLCPCHQSQFLVTAGRQAGLRPGHPAAAAAADRRSTTRATSSPRSDYTEAVGPAFWNRERI